MLKEENNPRQINGDPKRKWFIDDFFDLIAWLDKMVKLLVFNCATTKEKMKEC